MTHDNRGRLTVDPNGNWRLYQPACPEGWEMLGTVCRDVGDVGALARNEKTGRYAQWNHWAHRLVDGRKISAALGTQGKPVELAEGRRVNVYLDKSSLEKAAELGNGNVSEGIRIALRQC